MGREKHFDKLSSDERHLISLKAIEAIEKFLQLFISPVIARRIISVILIIAGVHHSTITELTGLHERSIRSLKSQLIADEIDDLFEIKAGRGRKAKCKDFETQIIEELNAGNYQTQQQIADMINDKFHIKVSVMTVNRLLKKTKSAS